MAREFQNDEQREAAGGDTSPSNHSAFKPRRASLEFVRLGGSHTSDVYMSSGNGLLILCLTLPSS